MAKTLGTAYQKNAPLPKTSTTQTLLPQSAPSNPYSRVSNDLHDFSMKQPFDEIEAFVTSQLVKRCRSPSSITPQPYYAPAVLRSSSITIQSSGRRLIEQPQDLLFLSQLFFRRETRLTEFHFRLSWLEPKTDSN